MFVTKDKRKIKELEASLHDANKKIAELSNKVNKFEAEYPFTIGDTVYDVQLRSAAGRFTKTKASREYSIINEVVVTTKNYFGLVNRYRSFDVFKTMQEAENHLNSVCVD